MARKKSFLVTRNLESLHFFCFSPRRTMGICNILFQTRSICSFIHSFSSSCLVTGRNPHDLICRILCDAEGQAPETSTCGSSESTRVVYTHEQIQPGRMWYLTFPLLLWSFSNGSVTFPPDMVIVLFSQSPQGTKVPIVLVFSDCFFSTWIPKHGPRVSKVL